MLNNSCLVVNAVLVIGDLRPKGVHTANRKELKLLPRLLSCKAALDWRVKRWEISCPIVWVPLSLDLWFPKWNWQVLLGILEKVVSDCLDPSAMPTGSHPHCSVDGRCISHCSHGSCWANLSGISIWHQRQSEEWCHQWIETRIIPERPQHRLQFIFSF